jgi:hypothetical protein
MKGATRRLPGLMQALPRPGHGPPHCFVAFHWIERAQPVKRLRFFHHADHPHDIQPHRGVRVSQPLQECVTDRHPSSLRIHSQADCIYSY